MSHRLSIYMDAKLVAQKKRKQGEEKREAVKKEVVKLMAANFVKEAKYTTWLANIVMVKKANDMWRMCTDYRDLNKSCPKEAYPLPSIDRLVDGAARHKILSFLDAYSSYNQIRMHLGDREKTSFMTEEANFYYEVMPFGLKNTGATYQQLMNEVFHGLIGRNVEVYMGDIVVKSDSCEQHRDDLVEVLGALRRYNMRLNPEKCVFSMEGEKFLGVMLMHRGIEANLNKCQAIVEKRSPKNVKEVQKLVGKLTAKARFIPRLVEKSGPIISLLKKRSKFEWSEECEEIFAQIKQFMAIPPVIQKPLHGQTIMVYLSISKEAISSVLVEEVGQAQKSVYFVSRTLQDAKRRYQTIEKETLALVHTTRRMRAYFQNHPIVVKTNYPSRKVLTKPDLQDE